VATQFDSLLVVLVCLNDLVAISQEDSIFGMNNRIRFEEANRFGEDSGGIVVFL
jgi:hypothetical protein